MPKGLRHRSSWSGWTCRLSAKLVDDSLRIGPHRLFECSLDARTRTNLERLIPWAEVIKPLRLVLLGANGVSSDVCGVVGVEC